ncbi:glycosyltransferase family 2 protein [uncultured Nonlabens sp.]|uniref:glycosyltransferase family 2 protein n=1 Tax=uncultured Nonlabens sp. TaxID=859306 RepID=UPI0030D942EE|tara:strand:+ start:40921 stop:41724 length:804 start_codon:yes stop_codon:yes gene_type:complete
MNPFFSIIIPTYNAEKLLPAALQSILEQSFHDYEVIIMDGLSKDETIEIAEEYAINNSKIKLYSKKDAGIYDAMNNGIKKANGKYLFFLGSDDTFYDNYVLFNVHKELKKTKVDVLYGCISSTRYGTKYDGAFTYEKLSKKNIGHQAIFFGRNVFDIIGDFNLNYKVLADWDHNIGWFFSKKVKNKYIDLVICNFSDGGFSSVYSDVLFEEERPYLILTKGWNKLNQKDIIKIAAKAKKIAKSKNNYLRLFLINILLLLYKMRINLT